jgi:hypothetical protein
MQRRENNTHTQTQTHSDSTRCNQENLQRKRKQAPMCAASSHNNSTLRTRFSHNRRSYAPHTHTESPSTTCEGDALCTWLDTTCVGRQLPPPRKKRKKSHVAYCRRRTQATRTSIHTHVRPTASLRAHQTYRYTHTHTSPSLERVFHLQTSCLVLKQRETGRLPPLRKKEQTKNCQMGWSHHGSSSLASSAQSQHSVLFYTVYHAIHTQRTSARVPMMAPVELRTACAGPVAGE